ncbi:uncharacterized protein [Ovis canadensis]|uniref:uncharacterized protein n=1 Tax=Ovis canadensis TaxID=37174 RepID=UPI0037504A6F
MQIPPTTPTTTPIPLRRVDSRSGFNPLEEQERESQSPQATRKVGATSPAAHTRLTHAHGCGQQNTRWGWKAPGLTGPNRPLLCKRGTVRAALPRSSPIWPFVWILELPFQPEPRGREPASGGALPLPPDTRCSHRPQKSRWRQVEKNRCYKHPSPASWETRLAGSPSPLTLFRAGHFRPSLRCRRLSESGGADSHLFLRPGFPFLSPDPLSA